MQVTCYGLYTSNLSQEREDCTGQTRWSHTPLPHHHSLIVRCGLSLQHLGCKLDVHQEWEYCTVHLHWSRKPQLSRHSWEKGVVTPRISLCVGQAFIRNGNVKLPKCIEVLTHGHAITPEQQHLPTPCSNARVGQSIVNSRDVVTIELAHPSASHGSAVALE